MARRVFLHVGCPKTGTSYLQSVLWNNRAALKKQGLLLPKSWRHHFRAALFIRGSIDERPFAPEITEDWAHLVRAVHKTSADVLITHELLVAASAQQAQTAIATLDGAETHVIITTRDLARQIPASWQQSVKQGSPQRFDDFVDEVLVDRSTSGFWRRQDIPELARRWGDSIPADHVHLVTCPPVGAERSMLWTRFASVLGVHDEGLNLTTSFANESLGWVEAELMRRINEVRYQREEGPGSNRWFRDRVANRLLGPREGKQRFAMRPSVHERIRDISVETVDQLTQGGYSVAGDLHDLVAPAELELAPNPSEADSDQLLTAAVETLVELAMAAQRAPRNRRTAGEHRPTAEDP